MGPQTFLKGMNGLMPKNLDDLMIRVVELGYHSLYDFLKDKTDQRYSMRAIGEMIDVTPPTVQYWQNRAGLKRLPKGGKPDKWRQ